MYARWQESLFFPRAQCGRVGAKEVIWHLQPFFSEELREQEQTVWPERRKPKQGRSLAETGLAPCALSEPERLCQRGEQVRDAALNFPVIAQHCFWLLLQEGQVKMQRLGSQLSCHVLTSLLLNAMRYPSRDRLSASTVQPS